MTKKKTSSESGIAKSVSQSISVDIKKANNGYVISSYDYDKPKTFIAKSKKEAMKYANRILKSK